MAEYMSGKSGLFYPHIHFRSREWLRASVLYYDRLARIVPFGLRVDTRQHYEAFMDDDVESLLNDIQALKSNGFILDESPEPHLSDVATGFSEFLARSLTDPAQRAKLIPALARDGAFYAIHPEKIDRHLASTLHEIGLMHRTQDDGYSNLEIEGVTGAFYMLHLANKMAGRRSLVTDESVYQSLMYKPAPNNGVAKKRKRDQELRLATAVFTTAIPTGLESVSIEKLLKVQDDLVDQRRRFQDKIGGLAKSMEGIEDEEELREQIESHARRLKDDQDELVDKLRSAQLTFGTGLFSVSVPAWVSAPWGFGQAALTPLVIGAGAIAVSGIAIKSIFDQRAAKRTNAMTYVLNIRKRLKPATEATRIVTLSLQRHERPPHGGRPTGSGGHRRKFH